MSVTIIETNNNERHRRKTLIMMHISHDIEYKRISAESGNDHLRWLCPGVEGYYNTSNDGAQEMFDGVCYNYN
jgi:hypothetical protein